MKMVRIESTTTRLTVSISFPKITFRGLYFRRFSKGLKTAILYFVYCLLSQTRSFGQDANAGINEANTRVRSYFAAGTSLMYAIGAIVGLIGAVKVYQKWNSGDPDTGKVAAAWFGSCVFLVVVATVIRSFFGV